MKPGLVGPIVLEGKIHVKTLGGVREVTVRFPPGHAITERDILLQLGKALTAVRRDNQPQAELFSAPEFFNGVLIADHYGHVGNFDLPESFDYDVDQVEAEAMTALASSLHPAPKAIQ